MSRRTIFVGMDVHKASIYVAVLEPGKQPADWQVENKPAAVAKLMKRLKALGDVETCYEAGPCGFALMRQFQGAGINCVVIAPALIPKKPGDRVKTDRRDARKLAEFLRAGILTAVHPPTPEQEGVRDLCRARDDVREDRMRARHRLAKFLLRHGRSYSKTQWTVGHSRWVAAQKFEHAAEVATLDSYVHTLASIELRLKALDDKIEEIAATDAYKAAVDVLRCFRGIETLTAMVILSELGDLTRFGSASKLMSFLGITPSERSSGGPEKRRPGAITKAGNGYVRRILVESAWHYRHRVAISKALHRRRKGQPLWAIAIADKCQERLAAQRRKLSARNKSSSVVNTAVARELAGFVWAALTEQARRRASDSSK